MQKVCVCVCACVCLGGSLMLPCLGSMGGCLRVFVVGGGGGGTPRSRGLE